ncbi:MAG: methyltransferase domain-containing protein [bacterium]
MIEIEPFGVDYERYSLSKCLGKIVRRYNISSCAELPAHGAKAMPSIYSLGLAQAGAHVTLINPSPSAEASWEEVNLMHMMTITNHDDIHHTSFPDDSFDFVWNFAYFPMDLNPESLLTEMKRISNRYVTIFSVNGRNVGAYIHRILHRVLEIPWTHGNVNFNFPTRLARFMKLHGLNIVKTGVTDCPFWPDSLGFRDVRLHRLGVVEMATEWRSKTLEWMKTFKYPGWIYGVYFFESIPMPLLIKYFYAHIFYIIGEKKSD